MSSTFSEADRNREIIREIVADSPNRVIGLVEGSATPIRNTAVTAESAAWSA
jgi:hypothetical protein